MDDFSAQFNNILVRAYHNVLLMGKPRENTAVRQLLFEAETQWSFYTKKETVKRKSSGDCGLS